MKRYWKSIAVLILLVAGAVVSDIAMARGGHGGSGRGGGYSHGGGYGHGYGHGYGYGVGISFGFPYYWPGYYSGYYSGYPYGYASPDLHTPIRGQFLLAHTSSRVRLKQPRPSPRTGTTAPTPRLTTRTLGNVPVGGSACPRSRNADSCPCCALV